MEMIRRLDEHFKNKMEHHQAVMFNTKVNTVIPMRGASVDLDQALIKYDAVAVPNSWTPFVGSLIVVSLFFIICWSAF